ncbi:YbgA family protein [Providencia sp. Me31A]|uniref:YbgA family protein n=1 Tax=Providencia sp. Me31A TaxID=3392637 RepID=UPI003D2AD9AA
MTKPSVFIFEGDNQIPINIQQQVIPIVKLMTHNVQEKVKDKAAGIIFPTQSAYQLIGLYPASIPILLSDKLQDIDSWDCFLTQLYVLQRLENLYLNLTHSEVIQFHSCHKYLIMAYSPVGYKFTGRLVASMQKNADLHVFFNYYKVCLMEIFASIPTRNIQVNALSHMQGYFKRKATKDEKKRLLWLINDYREGHLPISQPLTMMRQLLEQYPDNYLSKQYFFKPYPNCVTVREIPYR